MRHSVVITEVEADKMLSEYPIYFDDVEIPFPKTWNEENKVIESVNQSEAGTDIVNVTRMQKLSVTVSTTCLSGLAKEILAFSLLDSFVLKKYDLLTNAYKEYTVRMRDVKTSKVQYSEKVSTTNGVWKLSYRLEEF